MSADTIEQNFSSMHEHISKQRSEIQTVKEEHTSLWIAVGKQAGAADHVLSQCGVSFGMLTKKVSTFSAVQEQVSESSTRSMQQTKREMQSLGDEVGRLENVKGAGLTGVFNSLKSGVSTVVRLIGPWQRLGTLIAGSQGVWNRQQEAEKGLAAAMRGQLGASQAEIDGIVRLTAAQQALGVVSDNVQLAGARQMTAFGGSKQSLETLIPAMNDLLAGQKGLNAIDEDAARIGTLMGQAMQGQMDALNGMGLTCTEAQMKILRYGDEQQRAAMLAQLVAEQVGPMNQALAGTPEGRLKQHADTMGTLQERIGSLYTSVQEALLPLFGAVSDALGGVVGKFEENRDGIMAAVGAIASVLRGVFSLVGDVVGGVAGAFGWWLAKLQEGDGVITTVTYLLGALGLAIGGVTLYMQAMTIWTKLVTTAKAVWAAVQNGLNLALLLCPLTWIVAGIIALVGVIVFLCTKVQGWGTLWDGVVGFMKYGFLAFVEGIKLEFTTLVNGIMIGLDKIKLGWYKFKEACGFGDSAENQAAIARINADVEARQEAIAEGARKVAEYATKAKESLGGIQLSMKSGKSLGETVDGMKNAVGIGSASLPGMDQQRAPVPPVDTGGGITVGTGGNAGAGTASAISTGGTRSTSISIHLKSLVENLTFGSYEGDRETVQRDLESSLIRVLEMANSAQ